MFGDEKNLRDSSSPLGIAIKDSFLPLSYTKINKLIIAIYIVTDIIDKDEPIRIKLRTLGTEIISDINATSPKNLEEKVQSIVSFLDIGSALSLISPMNANILRKEFTEFQHSLTEAKQPNPDWLAEFLPQRLPHTPPELSSSYIDRGKIKSSVSQPSITYKGHSIGHKKDTYLQARKLGVQKPSSLMKVLSDMTLTNGNDFVFNDFKSQRRQNIIKVLKDSTEALTITDIKSRANGSLQKYSEKTLQRELAAMVKEGLLVKAGEKRWSRYSLSNIGYH